MYDKSGFKTENFPLQAVSDTLRLMSDEEFAALGAETIVFARPISVADLAQFVPQAKIAPVDAMLQMVVAADGAPVLVTDNDEAISDWLEDHSVTLVQRH